MDYKKLDEIADKLEKKHITSNAQESKEILALTQFYRVNRPVIKDSKNDNELKKPNMMPCPKCHGEYRGCPACCGTGEVLKG